MCNAILFIGTLSSGEYCGDTLVLIYIPLSTYSLLCRIIHFRWCPNPYGHSKSYLKAEIACTGVFSYLIIYLKISKCLDIAATV